MELDLDVHPSGIQERADVPEDVSVIFIDYALDNSKTEDLAAESIKEINRVLGDVDSSRKPIVVLMSRRESHSGRRN